MRIIQDLTLSLASLLCCAGAATAQLVDALPNPGDSFSGEISSGSDVDVVQFDSVAGAGLTIKLAPRKSKLVPHAAIFDMSENGGTLVAEASAAKKKLTLKFPNADKGKGLPNTGTYQIRVSGVDGSTGAFTLRFTEQLSKANKKTDQTIDVPAGAVMSQLFAAAAGMEASMRLGPRNKKSAADPSVPDVLDPDGIVVDLEQAKTKENKAGTKFSAKGVKLDKTGNWEVRATNEAAAAGALRVKISVKRAKAKKRKLTELPVGETNTTSLSGTIQASNDGLGLENVTISVLSPPAQSPPGNPEVLASTTTDVNGSFILQDLPAGTVEVRIDGTSVVNGPTGAAFGVLMIMAEVAAQGASLLPQALVLPDLNNPASAQQMVAVGGDGKSTAPIDAISGTGAAIELSGPTGTLIMIDGLPSSGAVELRVTPVSPDEVPMPLLDAGGVPLDAASYVTVQPPNAEFDTTLGVEGLPQGLDVVLPNDRGFPPGTLVDIWSFDHDAGAWMNRTQQTGQQGVVSPDGTQIVASGVIIKGGWHAPVVPVDPDCATKIVGRLIDDVTLAPIPDATVATDLGQFATTDANGEFTLNSVPAYELPSSPCVLAGTTLTLITSVDYGNVRVEVDVPAGSIVQAGCTEVGDITASIPVKGSLVCRVTENGMPVDSGLVDVTGPEPFMATTDADGQFFRSCLPAGSYVASHTFAGDSAPTQVAFAVAANGLATVNLQKSGGAGTHDLTVSVLRTGDGDIDFGPLPPVSGAKVLLVGSDATSSGGVIGTTNAAGKAVFENVDPPYTVTAQADLVLFDQGAALLVRVATSAIDVTPSGDTLTLPLEASLNDAGNDLNDAMVQGNVTNLPPGGGPPGVGGGEFFDMVFFDARGGGFQTTLPVILDGTGSGTYGGSIPSGLVLHAVLRQSGFFNEPSPVPGGQDLFGSRTMAAAFQLDIPAALPAGTTVVDFDFVDAVPFDREVPLDLQNMPATGDFLGLAFTLSDPGSELLELELGVIQVESDQMGSALVPSSVLLPDLNDPALSGFGGRYQAEVGEHGFFGLGVPGFNDRGMFCDVVLNNNPNQVSIPLPAAYVDLTSPQQLDDFDPAALDGFTISFDNQLTPSDRGFSSIFLGGEQLDQAVGVDGVIWQLLVDGAASQVVLPPTALPMFGNQGLYKLSLETDDFVGLNTTLEKLLSGNLQQNVRDLDFLHDRLCENFVDISFTVGGGGAP